MLFFLLGTRLVRFPSQVCSVFRGKRRLVALIVDMLLLEYEWQYNIAFNFQHFQDIQRDEKGLCIQKCRIS